MHRKKFTRESTFIMGRHTVIVLCIFAFMVHHVIGQSATLMCVSSTDGTESVPPAAGCPVSEGDGFAIISIEAKQGTDGQYATIDVKSADGGTNMASTGEDYIYYSTTITVPNAASATEKTILYIPIIDDDIIETSEEFMLEAKYTPAGGTAAPCATPCVVLIQITDNDVPCVEFDCPDYFVTEGGDAASIGVVIPGIGDDPVDVGFTATDLTTTAADDYTVDTTATVTTSPGMIEVTALGDSLVEGAEAFKIAIDAPSPAMAPALPTYKLCPQSTATVWIIDAPAAAATTPASAGATETPGSEPVSAPGPPATYSIEFCDYRADESQTPFNFDIKRSATGEVATITCSTRDVSAEAGLDYQALTSQTVTFAADSDTATCDVPILPDSWREDPEIFEISIASPSVGELGDITKATVTLYDASSSQSEFCLGSTLYPVVESSPAVTIQICRKGDCSQEASVVLSSSNVDAIAPNDYGTVNQLISFLPDEICKTQDVSIVNDKLLETTECFQVSLSQPTGGTIGLQSSATINIKDDDYCFSLESRYYSAAESDESLDIGIMKLGFYGDISTVVNFGTIEGSANAYEDYTGVTTSLDFPADTSIRYVGLTINQDGEYEDREKFTVAISAADPNRICQPSTATVVIDNSDPMCNPQCGSNGICTALNTCACQPGFTGNQCEQTQCTESCKNSGVCAGPNTCMCPDGYTGLTCEEVTCPNNYCLNGGECITTGDSYLCRCTEEYEGLRCQDTASTGLSGGAIAGIVVGAIAVFAILGIAFCVTCIVMQRPTTPSVGSVPGVQLQQPINGFGNNAMLMDGTTMQFPYQPDIY